MKKNTQRSTIRAVIGAAILAAGAGAFADSYTPLNGAEPRPFWVFGHNPNTLEEAELALQNGANALEPDLMVLPAGSHLAQAPFTPNPTGIVLYHDAYLATTRVPLTLEEYLTGLHTLAIKYPNLSLVVFDTKSPAATAANGPIVRDAVRNILNTDGVNVNVIFSISDRSDSALFDNILGDLRDNEGVQVDQEDNPEDLNTWWSKTEKYAGNIGYGDGTVGVGPNLPRAIDHGAFLRASTGFPKAVTYVYVLNAESSEDSFTYAGVDGIIPDTFFLDPTGPDLDPDYITDLIELLNAKHPEVRLATRADNPFHPPNEAYGLEIRTSDVKDAGTDGDLTFTLHGCRGDATITVHTGEIHIGYETGRMERNQTDWVTIPSKDLGALTSITVHNDGGLQDGWHLEDIRVSSARYLGADVDHSVEYVGNYNNWIDIGETKEVTLVPAPTYQVPAPTITCPAPILVGNDPNKCGAVVNFSPKVSGPCDDVVAVCNPPSGTLFPVGTTTVTCFASGGSGQSDPCTFTVTVVDQEVPVITCPAPVVAKATTPAGAVVTFSPTASDNCPNVQVASVPASGSVFAAGDTMVTCTATDAALNSASCMFNVHVKGAAEQLADLIAAVQNLKGPNAGIKNSLLAKLNQALSKIQGHATVACNTVNAFINDVSAQSGKSMSVADANSLIAAAQQIRAVIGCP